MRPEIIFNGSVSASLLTTCIQEAALNVSYMYNSINCCDMHGSGSKIMNKANSHIRQERDIVILKWWSFQVPVFKQQHINNNEL